MNTIRIRTRGLQVALLGGALLFAAGCNRQQTATQPARTDQQVANDVQAKIAAESALNGQNIQVGVTNGIATLSGTANDDASRALAGNDAGSVDGVKTVVNNLTVEPPKQAAAPAPVAPPPPVEKKRKHREEKQVAEAAPEPPPAPAPAPAPVEQAPPPAPAPPPPPPQPVAKTVTIPAGSIIPVRITEALSSKDAQPNQVFHGSLAGDLIADGMVAVPQGASVTGRVVDAKDAAHFAGSSLLSIELTQISTKSRQIPVVTEAYSKEGQGRGKNTAVKTGGGAALGAIIGGLAGGGRGAAIGAAAGGATGAGVNAVTRGQQVQIQPETLVNFKLQSPITVTTTHAVGQVRSFDDNSSSDPQLEQRQPQ
ncbi:BON domain-containing protein [Alloacidobacterium dinghuense]|uniref:BON domain-containing protein n=1 Tax=Alloacidobacterium dinghuense TaxID=2763107 RepID=A0A7G8BP85_9BACT|nr:BON domain-containing protein [Alloacidobacterium dinghuense]QNI34355.1 BON domain-containing protein [Alloacidobacterium dinghuense]